MDLCTAAAYLALDQLRGEDLPAVAMSAIAQGTESESLILLAAEEPAPLRDLAELFMRALNEIGGEVPSKDDAAMTVARYRAMQALDGVTSPYEAARKIVFEAVHPMSATPKDLAVFVALESEYEDFSDPTRKSYYGDDHCRNVRNDIEAKIMEEVQRLLDSAA